MAQLLWPNFYGIVSQDSTLDQQRRAGALVTAIPKRTRYEVLRRDSYTCRYCGAKAPDVKLNVDAVTPEVLGGSHKDPANLVTACEACNNGKTSSSPDAPLVADVADKALEWAQAMRQAQTRMLADIEARQADRDQFRQWWDGWTRDGALMPKDAGWEQTVDQFRGAGLPLLVIKDCIELAMTRRKVQDDNRFKYMCGIAWSKITELQKAASSFASGGAPVADDATQSDDLFEQGRLSLARELLDEMSEEERAHFLDAADVRPWQDENDEPQTESQVACEAVTYALDSARSNLAWLAGRAKDTLKAFPDDLGARHLAEAEAAPTSPNPQARMTSAGIAALYAIEDLIDLPAAAAWIDALPEAERLEWLEYAQVLYPNAHLSPERLLVRAMHCARVANGDSYYEVMCQGPGKHISACPVRGTHFAQIAEMKCCGPDRDEDHQGHLVCEHHLELLMDGTYVSAKGKNFSAVDFTEVSADEWAPF